MRPRFQGFSSLLPLELTHARKVLSLLPQQALQIPTSLQRWSAWGQQRRSEHCLKYIAKTCYLSISLLSTWQKNTKKKTILPLAECPRQNDTLKVALYGTCGYNKCVHVHNNNRDTRRSGSAHIGHVNLCSRK